MSVESPGKGINFQGTVGSTAVVTIPFNVSQLQQAAYQIRTDGSAAVSYTLQASNVPAQANSFGPPYRNDAVTSPDWGTVQTGTTSTGAGGTSAIISLTIVPYRFMRLVMTANANVTTTVFAFGTGS